MKKIYYATTNKAKVYSLSSVLAKYDIAVIQAPINVEEPRTDDLREIAMHKVRSARDVLNKPVVALDSGFYIHALNGFPRTFVNFALGTIGLRGILKLVEDKPRGCEFRNCLAYLDDKLHEPVCFESTIPGTLADAPRGELREYAWSELFLVFVPRSKDKTLAEMTRDEYQKAREEIHANAYSTQFGEWFSRER